MICSIFRECLISDHDTVSVSGRAPRGVGPGRRWVMSSFQGREAEGEAWWVGGAARSGRFGGGGRWTWCVLEYTFFGNHYNICFLFQHMWSWPRRRGHWGRNAATKPKRWSDQEAIMQRRMTWRWFIKVVILSFRGAYTILSSVLLGCGSHDSIRCCNLTEGLSGHFGRRHYQNMVYFIKKYV